MAEFYTTHSNFVGGEVSPKFYSALQDTQAATAMAEIYNGLVTLQGSIAKRAGTVFFDYTSISGNVRLWPFITPENRRDITLWSAGQVRLRPVTASQYSDTPDSAQVEGFDQRMINPTFSARFTGWKTLGDVLETKQSAGRDYSSRMNYWQGQRSYKGVSNTSDRSLSTYMQYDGWPAPEDTRRNYVRQFFNGVDIRAVVVRSEVWYYRRKGPAIPYYVIRLGSTEGGNDLGEYKVLLATSQQTYKISESLTLSDDYTGPVHVEAALVFEDTPNTKTTWQDHTMRFDSVYVYTTSEPPPADITLETPYTDTDIEQLHFIQSPFANKELLVLCPEYPIYALYFDVDIAGTYVFEPYTFTAIPPLWGQGYPTVAAAYQSRLILGGAKERPETVWGSKVNEWNDFSIQGQPDPSDAIEVTPVERGFVRWLSGFKNLLYGTEQAEYTLESQTGIFQASDIGVNRQSSYGGTRSPQIVPIGHSVPLPTAGNTGLRMLMASRDDLGYIAPDIFSKAEHLGQRVIRRYFHVREPHNQLWCIMVDGTIAVLTYDDTMEMQAWSQLETDGRFIDGQSLIDDLGRTIIILIVERSLQGQTFKTIEVIRDIRHMDRWQYLDFSRRVFVDKDATEAGGFGHLVGRGVALFIDGEFWADNVEVRTGGFVDIPAGSTEVAAGVPVQMRVQTLPFVPQQPSTDLAFDGVKRYVTAGVRYYKSKPPVINGIRPPDRSAVTLMGTIADNPLVSEVSVALTGHDRSAQITIEEPLPLGLTIEAIYGKLSSKKL